MFASFLRRRSVRLFAAIGATLIAVATGSNAWSADANRHETWNWSGPLAAGRTLEINGVNGEIVAEPAAGGTVEVVAEKTGKRHDPAEVEIKVKQDSDGITICAIYPGQSSPCSPIRFGFHNKADDVQVNFRVKVPAGVAFTANNVNGAVRVRSLAGPVKAHTVNGECEIETSQTGEASTVNGSVSAVIGKVSAKDRLSFNTVNGSITLRLPDGLDADLEGSTVNGDISTTFPISVSGKWGPRSMHGTVGHGGAKLSASTVNGSIRMTGRAD